MNFLYLSEEHMIEAGVTDMKKCINSMEYMFKLLKKGDYRMGGKGNNSHGLRVTFPKTSNIENMPLDGPGRWFTTMPAYLGGKYHIFGIKSYGANQDNYKKNLPRSILMMSLLDVETGMPLAYMSANILSAMRTGAISGLAAKYLANPNSSKIAIIGPGVIGRYSLDAIMEVCTNIKNISVLDLDSKNIKKFQIYCENKNYKFEEFNICTTMEEVCKDADIILTSNSQNEHFEDYPYLEEKHIKNGATVIVTSALRVNKHFINDNSKVICVADDSSQYKENRSIDASPINENESITFKNALHEKIINNQKVYNFSDIIEDSSFERNKSKIYLFASGGLPIEDVAWASECYYNAIDKNIGIKLPIWDENTKL